MIKLILGLTIFITMVVSLIFYKIQDDKKPHRGDCMMEINKKYFSSSYKGTIYKIDSVQSNRFGVSTWTNKKWNFLKNKKKNYFDDGKTFEYKKVPCPDRVIREDNMNERMKDLKFK